MNVGVLLRATMIRQVPGDEDDVRCRVQPAHVLDHPSGSRRSAATAVEVDVAEVRDDHRVAHVTTVVTGVSSASRTSSRTVTRGRKNCTRGPMRSA